MLTFAEIVPQSHEGGGYMKGSIQKISDRWCVSIYWHGKRYRIFRYNGEPMWHEKVASKLLNVIRAEVDDKKDSFDIRPYLKDSPVALRTFSETWLADSRACNNTKRVYRSAINKAIEFYGADKDIRKIIHSDLLKLYNWLPYSIKGKYNVLTTLKSMLNYAVKDGFMRSLPPFPALSIGLPDDIQYLTYDEQQRVLQAIPEAHRGVFEFAMEYGLRIGEIIALQKDCIVGNEIIIKRSMSNGEIRETTKTGKIRKYQITNKARKIISSAFSRWPFSAYVFCKDERGHHYNSRVLNSIWRMACQGVGLSINLYCAIRHSLGCQLLDENQPIELVRDILGHTSTNMTRRYAKRNPAQVLNALENRGSVIAFSLPKSDKSNN